MTDMHGYIQGLKSCVRGCCWKLEETAGIFTQRLTHDYFAVSRQHSTAVNSKLYLRLWDMPCSASAWPVNALSRRFFQIRQIYSLLGHFVPAEPDELLQLRGP